MAGGDQLPAAVAVALGVEQVGVERRGVELGLLLGRRDLAQQAVDRLDRLRRRLVAGPLGQRRQLQQLQVAGDRPVDVDAVSRRGSESSRPACQDASSTSSRSLR